MKRKRFQDLDKMEKDSLMRRALPTQKVNVKAGEIPLDGFQYLQMVQKEAKAIPDVIVANLSIDHHEERLHEIREEFPLHFSESWTLPSLSWYDKFILEFKRLKRDFQSIKSSQPKEALDINFAQVKNESCWKKILYIDQYLQPTIKLLMHINHTLALKLVKFHTIWISNEFSDEYCKWLFCLFLIIDPLLTSEQVDIIRKLARKLQDIDSSVLRASDIASITIILSIICGIYGQKDIFQDLLCHNQFLKLSNTSESL